MNSRKIGILISYINIALSILIGFLYVPILLFYIGTSEYGLYQLIGSVIAFFSIMDGGLTITVVKFYTKYKTLNDKKNMENILALSMRGYFIISILLMIIGIICYFNLDKIFSKSMTNAEIESAKNLFILMIFNITISMSSMIFKAIINAYQKFLVLKGLDSIQLVIQPILVILLIREYPYAFSVAFVQTVLNICLILFRIYYCFNKLNIRIRYHNWDKSIFNAMKKLAISSLIITIVDQVFFKSNQIILGIINGTLSVAVYSVATLIYMNYMSLGTAISGVYLPHITEMMTKNKSIEEISKLFIKIGRWQFFLLSGISSGFFIFGKSFIDFWAGKNFEEAYWIAIIIIIPFTIDIIQNIGLSILIAQNKYDFRAKVYFCMGILNICLAVPLGAIYGGIGCAIATGLSMFIGNGLIMNWYYLKITKLDIVLFWKNIGRIAVGVIIITIIGYIFNELIENKTIIIFVIKLLAYSLLYIGIMYKFFMNIEEKFKIKNLILKFKN